MEMTNASAKSHKQQYFIFVKEMATHGQQRRAYMAAYPGSSPETADRGAGRLMDRADIRECIEMGREKINRAQQHILETNIARQLREIEEKREILRQVYRGDVLKTTTDKNNVVTKKCEDPMTRLHAMKQDNELAREMVELICEMAKLPGLAVALQNVLNDQQAATQVHTEVPVAKKEPATEMPVDTDNNAAHDDDQVATSVSSLETDQCTVVNTPFMSRRARRELEKKNKKGLRKPDITGHNRTFERMNRPHVDASIQ